MADAVVLPFGVPDDARGLGLGLASLVHAFVRIDGRGVALAQLQNKPSEGSPPSDRGPVEAFVPAPAFREIIAKGPGPSEVPLVLTGVFEPPTAGRGQLQLVAYDPETNVIRGSIDAVVDETLAGKTVYEALRALWSSVGGDATSLSPICDLDWEGLESLLRGEAAVVIDPARGLPYDNHAALVHLGRAVSCAPQSRFVTSRLAQVALDAASASGRQDSLAESATRTLREAVSEAPDAPELLEALAAVEARLSAFDDAIAHAREAIACDASRPRPYAVLCEAFLGRGEVNRAREAISAGLAQVPSDPLLRTSEGILALREGDLPRSAAILEDVIRSHPLYGAAFMHLASIAMGSPELRAVGGPLVDQALATSAAPSDIYRRAIDVALACEPTGVARAARIAKLARILVDRSPTDAWARFILGKCLVELGERGDAARNFRVVEESVSESALAAESHRERLALEQPEAWLEFEAVVRAARTAEPHDLEAVAARARRLGTVHQSWIGHWAAGLAERRAGNPAAALREFRRALDLAPGATSPRDELAALEKRTSHPPPPRPSVGARMLAWVRGGRSSS
jgi:tetratricopeptide (TPR) repeat protein